MITSANRSPKEKNTLQSLYLNSEQTKELVAVGGANAVLIFTHYIGISFQTNPNMEDEQLSKLTGLSVRVIKRTRLELVKAGWFLKIKGKYQKKDTISYHLGKTAVSQDTFAVLKL
jgi:hypothetical protein